MTRLWLPYQVSDLPAAEKFFTDQLGLSIVDWWDRDGEAGRVLAPDSDWEAVGGGAVVELVTAARDRAAPPAFELPDRVTVDAFHRRFAPGEVTRPPGRYPRGHYGFEVTAPGGFPLMIWSER